MIPPVTYLPPVGVSYLAAWQHIGINHVLLLLSQIQVSVEHHWILLFLEDGYWQMRTVKINDG